MNPQSIKKNIGVFLISFLLIFISTSMVFLAVTMTIQSEADRVKRVEMDITEKSLVASEKNLIDYKFQRITSDIRFIYDTLFQNFSDDHDFSKVETLWQSYSTNRKVYDQIRFLDTDGNEVIRVDYSPDGSVILRKDQMQNKKDRYYFQNAVQLQKDQIYLSPMDLNIENGAIELPVNPVVRLAMAFYDPSGTEQGIIVLNYSATDILNQISSLADASFGQISLLNSDGYWLYSSSDGYREWAFSYDADSPVKFPNYFPDEWALIAQGGSGSFATDFGFFHYTTVNVSESHTQQDDGSMIACDMGNLYVVSYIPVMQQTNSYPSEKLSSLALFTLGKYGPIYVLLLAISIVLSTFITLSKSKSNQVRYFSEYDTMTGALNRRYGIEKLSSLYKNIEKAACQISLCFIDVNGLKAVNDTLGHEAGDELLTTVASTFRSLIRIDDYLIRLGGDEFLIVYSGVDAEQAEQAWQRIVASLESINQTEQRKYVISVSHGIETLSCSVNSALDDVLHRADTKMYQEKQQIKQNLKIIRDL